MTDLELLECTQSVYDFLIDCEDINLNKSFNSFMEFSTFMKMIETLTRYRCCKENGVADMVGFTIMLNNRFKLYDIDIFEERMRNDTKPFFSTTISHNFYRTILRELKLNLCLRDQKLK